MINLPLDHETSIAYRAGNSIGTFWGELNEDGHEAQRYRAAVIAATTQVVERGRFMAIALPVTFDKTLNFAEEHGFNGWETASVAGIAVGGLFGAWSMVVGRTFHDALDLFPETSEATIQNHPVMTSVITKAAGGFPNDEAINRSKSNSEFGVVDLGPYAAADSKIGKIGLASSRGIKAGFLFGETAYVGIAKILNYPRKRINQLRAAVTVESGLVLGGVGAGVSGLVSNNILGTAERIRDTITDKKILIGAQVGLIGYSAVSNWASRRKFIGEQSTNPQTDKLCAKAPNHSVPEDFVGEV